MSSLWIGRTKFAHRLAGRPGVGVFASTFLMAVTLLSVVPPALGGSNLQAVAPPGDALPATYLAAKLVASPIAGVSSSTFWGVVAQTNSPTGISTDPSVGGFLNQSPFRWFEYTEGTDQCNITSNTLYDNAGGVAGKCGFSIQSMKQWCSSRGPSCHAILLLPGENNNSYEVGAMADYIVNTLHFQPSYFAIGNEPELWHHYGISWSHWKNSDRSTPTPREYAYDVKAGIAAVRAVDPTAKFIGIEADCECSPTWFTAVAQIDGPLISAIAYHTYPSTAGLTHVTTSQFFSALIGSKNISTSYSAVRASIVGKCPGCATLPIFIAEYKFGPGWAPSNFAGSWTDAVFLAASAVQAIRENVSMFATFNLQNSHTAYDWSMINQTNVVGPEGLLYSKLLEHLHLGEFRDVSVHTNVTNIWAVECSNGANHTLLVVNANPAQGILLDMNSVLWIGTGSTPVAYHWSPGMAGPLVVSGLLAASYGIPSQGILMIDYTN